MSLEDRSDRIDHDAPRHIWQQLADDIRADISSGALAPGAKLPSEPELATQYGVSRATVRRVVRELVSEGLLTVIVGRGTYVSLRRG